MDNTLGGKYGSIYKNSSLAGSYDKVLRRLKIDTLMDSPHYKCISFTRTGPVGDPSVWF